jgi:hypothetical protein
MRELITVTTSVAVLLLATSATAQDDEDAPEFGTNVEEGLEPVEQEETGKKPAEGYLGQLTVGFRSGYALPMGKDKRDAGQVSMNDVYVGQVPLWLDIGYEPLPNLMLGGFGLWGPAFVAAADPNVDPADPDLVACPQGGSCFGHVFRGGGQAHWLFAPHSTVDPWVGLGAAYEFAWVKRTVSNDTRKRLNRGPEIINVQAGLDIKPKDELAIGPFVSFSIDRYTACKNTENGSQAARCDIERRAQHFWLMMGARVYFSAIQVKKKGVDLTPPP